MKRLLLSMVALPLVIGGLSVSASADGINILNNVKVKGEIRPRYEYANIKNNTKKAANAYTVRTRIGVGADLFDVNGLSAFIEGTSVNNIAGRYNSTSNGQTGYDKVVDPRQARLTQAYIDYKIAPADTLIRAGRQEVNIDNQRFIGSVGWRQMFQTFDAAAVINTSVKNLTLMGAYVYGTEGVKDTPSSDLESYILHANYKVNNMLNITAYDYILATAKNTALHYGSDTYGLALTGKPAFSGVKLNYRAEYAKQKDASVDNSRNAADTAYKADAYYYNLDLGANISGVLVGVNYEFLSGTTGTDGKTAFATPFATGHKFNGWADMFLGTPTGGLKDANVRLGYKAKGLGKLLAIYHNFTADKNMNVVGVNAGTATGTTNDLGSEFDIVYVNAIPGVKNLKGLVKYASYSKGKAEQGAGTTYKSWGNDKKVAWLMLDYKFSTK